MSATTQHVPWPARADITPALREIETFVEDLEAGKYRDVPNTYEALGRLTAIAQGLETDMWFIDDLRKRLVKGIIEPMAGEIELPPLDTAVGAS